MPTDAGNGAKRAAVPAGSLVDRSPSPTPGTDTAGAATERRQTERLLAGQNRVLEMMAAGADLDAVLTALCRSLEDALDGALCSILLVDDTGERLRHGAAPGLPATYTTAVDGVAIGPRAGSCGTAAYRGETVVVTDVATDPLWADWKDLALAHGLCACWSEPIRDRASGQFLGTFAVYHREPRAPRADELAIVVRAGALAGVAVQRARAEAALRAAEARYRALVEQVPAVIYVEHLEGWIDLYVSPQIEPLLGYTPADLLAGHPTWMDLVHPEDRDRVEAAVRRSDETGGPYAEEYRMLARDGRVVWIHNQAILVRDEAGRPRFWQGVVIDLTARKEAEEALRRSDARFRSLIANATDIITLLDAAGTIRYESPAVERFLGHRPDDLLGRNAFDLIHPADRDRVWDAFTAMVADPSRKPTVELRFRHADGSWRWLESTGINLLADPDVGCVVVNSRDVTERRQAETALREAEARYRALVEQVPAVVYTQALGEAVVVTYVSPQVETVLGYAPSEIVGQRGFIEDRLHPADRQRMLAENARTDRTGEPFAMEYRVRAKDGRWVWLRDEAVLVRDADGHPVQWQGVLFDVTDQKRAEERLAHLAHHDPLTGLPNRVRFREELRRGLRDSAQRNEPVAVLFLDLDRFKVVNDSLGHQAGDRLLVAAADRVATCLPEHARLARLGGDEFVVLVPGAGRPAASAIARHVLTALRTPLIVDGREVTTTASIGLAIAAPGQTDPDEALRGADLALYRAKGAGGNRQAIFEPQMAAESLARLELEGELRRAVERHELVVHYQPTVDLTTGRVVTCEALVRWDHPSRGQLTPPDFLPLAEETGLIVPIGERVLFEACHAARGWGDDGGDDPPIVCVNVSLGQLREPGLVPVVRRALGESGLTPSRLCLEVSEHALLGEDRRTAAVLRDLKEIGVRLALDDFGAGHSSLVHLHRLPFDALKLDRAFVAHLAGDDRSVAVVRAVIGLAHALGMTVTAEGVERTEQRLALRSLGCDHGQGYLFARPLPACEVEAILTSSGGDLAAGSGALAPAARGARP